MNVISIVILVFVAVGAVDFILGNRFGVGREFERGFALFCPMALSMLGMIVIAPAIGELLSPVFDGFYDLFGIDPSIIPASLLANDMGGAPLADSVAKSETLGGYNAYVVSSMMGCVLSFTIPFSLGLVKKEQHGDLFLGLLCGIVTIPVGCVVAGLMCGIGIGAVLLNLLPLIILSVIVCVALIFVPRACIKCFSVFGVFMRVLAIGGLLCSVFTRLTGVEICTYFATFDEGALVCANACVTLAGALPFMFIVSRLLDKPLSSLGKRIGINSTSALALLGTVVTNASTFGVMEKMDRKGVVLNSAFAVSAAFTIGGHLAFTMAYDSSYVPSMIVGKLISGVFAVALAFLLYKRFAGVEKAK